ncbi:pentapeptide repeat-containing protein [Myxococcota bacterium]|nr:pentapeptide repeat-containing protein [Myxococcota bacterium]
MKEAKLTFGGRPKQSLLLRRCGLITGLAARAAQEVAPLSAADAKAFAQEVERAWGICAETVPDPEEAARDEALADWLKPPLSTPWGLALWDTLTHRQTRGLDPWLSTSEERRAFERRFMAAWSLNTSTGEGAEVERAVLSLRELDAAQLQEQLVADLATWGGRHVFGNLRAGAELQGMPWMSLEAVYVEPEVEWGEWRDRQRGPALRTLWTTVQKHPLTLVTAHMGLGKTLTARMFVRERALDWLEANGALGERWLPVYVRCADHLQADEVDLEALVAKAWASQWEGLSGETLRSRDPRLSLPREETRLVIVLDGLNEVHLRQDQVERLLHMLHTAVRCPTLRVVVFSRPGAVPAKVKLPKSAGTLEVQPFEEAQVNEWLHRWRALHQAGPRSIEEVQDARIRHWLSSPVLLFMLAWTWHSHNGRLPSGVALYEQFLRRVAQNKTEHDRERHPVIAEATKDVRDRLIQLNHLSPGATPEDGMLWLLGRVALEMHRREQTLSAGPLNRQGVENLVEKLLGLRADTKALELLSLGCVLATRADLRGDQPALLFGHRSFQEFLVARAWREQLRRIVSPPQGSTRKKEERVLEGLLIQGQGDYTIHFLTELVGAEEPTHQVRLKGWAKSMVEDLRVGRPFEDDDERPTTYTDTRASLALAAFAIGGAIAGERWFTVNGAVPLRRVLAWARLTRSVVSVIAPKLSRGEEEGWSLTRADLSGADLSFADLSDADLSGANLSRAYLPHARLPDANLSNASLCRADLFDANLHRANLSGADLSDASLYIAYFPNANLHRANLSGADLSDAMLPNANLSDANLYRANLSDADLFGANLHRANLSCTSLYEVNLYNAQDLSTANLHNARFTINHPYYSDTRWPLEFPAEAAIAAGAHPNLPGQDAWPDPHPDPADEPPTPETDGDPT